MLNYIEFLGGTQFIIPATPQNPIENRRTGREWKAITVTGIVEDAKAAFIDNAQYTHYWESQKYDDEGNLDGTEMRSEDLSEYCIAGDIVDLRNGDCVVYMGKKTEKEELIDALASFAKQAGTKIKQADLDMAAEKGWLEAVSKDSKN